MRALTDTSYVLSREQLELHLYSWGQARLKEGRHIEAVAAFEDVLARFPRHDLADNSLYWMGVCQQGRGEHRLAIADWQKLLDFNLTGTFLFTHAVVPVMKRQRSGKIVNLSSVAASTGS